MKLTESFLSLSVLSKFPKLYLYLTADRAVQRINHLIAACYLEARSIRPLAAGSGSDFVGIKHHFQPDLPVLLSNWQLLLSPTNRGHIKSTKSSLIGSNFSVSGPVIVMKSKDQEIEVMAKSLHKMKIILFPKLMGAS